MSVGEIGSYETIVVKSDARDHIDVIMGDDKETLFYPQGKIERWDNEANLSFRLMGKNYEEATVRSSDDRIIWETTTDRAEFYQVAPDAERPDGAFEFEVVLLSRPVSNHIQFSLVYKDLEFHYQPVDVVEPGGIRPDHIKGSYAVYRVSRTINIAGGKLYRTGKIGHIHRPKAVDAKLQETWCDLLIENDVMTITVPDAFLDSAEYPVSVDPTFGYETIGGSHSTFGTGTIYASGADYPDSDGTATAIYIYAAITSTTNIYAGLYDDSSGPNAIVGTENLSQLGSGSAAWRSCATNELSVVNGTTYWCAINPDTSPDQYYDSLGGTNRYWCNHTFGTAWPSTYSQDSSSSAKYSMYCEYTETGAKAPIAMDHYRRRRVG